MIARLRQIAKALLPARAVHAYRMLAHTTFSPFEQEIALLPRFLDPGKVALDVGANTGLFMTLMARHSRKVLAFEPHPGCAAQLRKLGIRNCEVIEAALSDREGEAALRIPLAEGLDLDALCTLTDNDFHTQPQVSGIREVTVAATRLDTALASRLTPADAVSFLKIDVEGHELAVLRGAAETIARHRPVLLVEIEARHGVEIDDVLGLLARSGYAAHARTDDAPLQPVDARTLRELQSPERLARKLAEPRYFGYVNNIFFLPAGRSAA